MLLFISGFGAVNRLPEQFTIVERFLSLTSTFDISTETETFAIARKRFFSLTTTFDLEDMNELPIANASSRYFAWGTVADITDPKGLPIGSIQEEVIRILPWALYKVYNSQNEYIALAKMNFWGTAFEIYHPDNPDEVYATISRPFFRFYFDYWTVHIKNREIFENGIIDPRILIILAIYQTDKDSRDRFRKGLIDQFRTEQDFYDERRFE